MCVLAELGADGRLDVRRPAGSRPGRRRAGCGRSAAGDRVDPRRRSARASSAPVDRRQQRDRSSTAPDSRRAAAAQPPADSETYAATAAISASLSWSPNAGIPPPPFAHLLLDLLLGGLQVVEVRARSPRSSLPPRACGSRRSPAEANTAAPSASPPPCVARSRPPRRPRRRRPRRTRRAPSTRSSATRSSSAARASARPALCTIAARSDSGERELDLALGLAHPLDAHLDRVAEPEAAARRAGPRAPCRAASARSSRPGAGAPGRKPSKTLAEADEEPGADQADDLALPRLPPSRARRAPRSSSQARQSSSARYSTCAAARSRSEACAASSSRSSGGRLVGERRARAAARGGRRGRGSGGSAR